MPALRTRTETHDCTCPVRRPHGTPHTYRYHRCGCEPCRTAHLAYLQSLKKNAAAGRSAYVPVDQVARHLMLLRRHGVSIPTVARATGYHPGSLYRIAQRAKPLCRRELADDVLSYPVPKKGK